MRQKLFSCVCVEGDVSASFTQFSSKHLSFNFLNKIFLLKSFLDF